MRVGTEDSAVASTSWRSELSWRRTFRDADVEREYQTHHRATHTVRKMRWLFLASNFLWMSFVLETVFGEGSQLEKGILLTSRLLPTLISCVYQTISFSRCSKLAERSAYESAIPGGALMGVTLALQAVFLHNIEASTVPLGWMIVIPFTVCVVRMTIVQTIAFVAFEIVVYAVCYYVPRPDFVAGLPVMFALVASGLTAVAISEHIVTHSRHMFWLMRQARQNTSTSDQRFLRSPESFALALKLNEQTRDTASHYHDPSIRSTPAVSTDVTPDLSRRGSANLDDLLLDPSAVNVTTASSLASANSLTVPTTASSTLSSTIGLRHVVNPRIHTSADAVSKLPSASMRLTLAFRSAPLEDRFRAWLRREVHHNVSFVLLCMLIGEVAFGISDYAICPHHLVFLLSMRYGGTVPLFLIGLAASRRRSAQARVHTLLPLLVSLIGATKFLTVALLPWHQSITVARTFSSAVLRYTLHAHASFQLRTVHLFLATTPWVAGTIAVQFLSGQSILESALQFVTWLAALVLSYLDEKNHRTRFLLAEYVANDPSTPPSSTRAHPPEGSPAPAWIETITVPAELTTTTTPLMTDAAVPEALPEFWA